jgi:hypothetical protein
MSEYHWPGFQKDVDLYIKSCTSCGRNKSSTQAPAGFLYPMPIPERRFDELALNFVGKLAISKGFDTVLVMTDRLTDYVKFEPRILLNSSTLHGTANLESPEQLRWIGINYLRATSGRNSTSGPTSAYACQCHFILKLTALLNAQTRQ